MSRNYAAVAVLIAVAILTAIFLILTCAFSIAGLSITREWAIGCTSLGGLMLIIGAVAGGVAMQNMDESLEGPGDL